MKSFRIALALLGLTLPAVSQAQAPGCTTLDCLKKAVKTMAAKGQAQDGFVGLSVIAVDKAKGSFRAYFGYQDLEHKIATNQHSIYEIGSITKPFTFLTLAVQDKIKITDTIGKYLPAGVNNPKPNGQEIQFQHLMTHTAEIPRRARAVHKGTGNQPDKLVIYGVTNEPANPHKNMTEKAFYEFISASAKMFEDFPGFKSPGYYYEYSSMGTALAGELVARAHGQSFEDYVHQRILEPLKMTSSFLSLPCPATRDCSQLAKVYEKRKKTDPWRQTSWRTAPFAKGTGRLKTTPVDMEKFLRANLDPDSTPIAAALKRGQQPLPDVTASHNQNICKEGQDPKAQRCNRSTREFYWSWSKRRSDPVLWHNGATTGSEAMMMFSQDHSFGVVVFANSAAWHRYFADEFAKCVMAIAGKIPDKDRRCEAFYGKAR